MGKTLLPKSVIDGLAELKCKLYLEEILERCNKFELFALSRLEIKTF